MRQFSYTLAPSLVERMKAAIKHTAHRPDGSPNQSALVRAVILREVKRLEARYNHGRPFPRVEGRLTSGPDSSAAVRGARLRAHNRKTRGKPTGPGPEGQ
ncbi:hypothetical protein [Streptomyces sp. Ac-502]|uniref:ParB family protein n=1 Tax=Streptomyces sp. Ac-502 TaxID=3342801 RepID=UPI0038626476